jgi:chromosome segregation ATPase
MEKMRLIQHARETETRLNEYLELIYAARQDALRTISSLEGIILNIDLLLEAAASEFASPGEAKEELELMAAHARTLAHMALSAANNTVTMIQANIPKTKEGAAKTMGLVKRLTRGRKVAEVTYDSLYLALAEITKVIRQVEEEALRCVKAAEALLPQVENLQDQILLLMPQLPGEEDSNEKKIAARLGVSLSLVKTLH